MEKVYETVDRVHTPNAWVHSAYIKLESFILRWRAAILFDEGVSIDLIMVISSKIDG
jgi:hypothetical protein